MYKVNSENLKGSFSISNLILFIGLVAFIIIGLVIFPAKIKEATYTEKVEAYDDDFYYYSTDEIYKVKFYYLVDGKEYSLTTNADKDDRNNYDLTIYYKNNNPESAISKYEIEKANDNFFLLIIPGVLLLFGFIMTINSLIKVLKVQKLTKKGILVKNIPYMLIDKKAEINGHKIMAYCITYTFPNGNTKDLVSNGIHTRVSKEGVCDLLYDPNNYSNYYIDKNIKTTGKGNPTIIYYQQN